MEIYVFQNILVKDRGDICRLEVHLCCCHRNCIQYGERGVFKTRNGEMTKWRNGKMTKWRNGIGDKSQGCKITVPLKLK